MKRMINSIVLLITILLIGFCFLISLIPDVTLTSGATLGCYMIPAIMIIITMIIQIKKEKNIKQMAKSIVCCILSPSNYNIIFK